MGIKVRFINPPKERLSELIREVMEETLTNKIRELCTNNDIAFIKEQIEG